MITLGEGMGETIGIKLTGSLLLLPRCGVRISVTRGLLCARFYKSSSGAEPKMEGAEIKKPFREGEWLKFQVGQLF
jgi:hypothetical protein